MGLCPGLARINVICTNPIVHSLWGLRLDMSEAAASVHARRLDTYGGSMEQQLGALLSDDQPARDDLRRVLFSFANFMCNSLEVIQSLRVSSPSALRQCSLFGMRSSVQDVQRLAMLHTTPEMVDIKFVGMQTTCLNPSTTYSPESLSDSNSSEASHHP